MNYSSELSGIIKMDVGLFDFEHKALQDVKFCIVVHRSWNTQASTQINNALNYDVIKQWMDAMSKLTWILLEDLALKTVDHLMNALDADEVDVRFSKPEIYLDSCVPSVNLNFTRQSWVKYNNLAQPEINMVLAINQQGTIGLKSGVIPWLANPSKEFNQTFRMDFTYWTGLIKDQHVAIGFKTFQNIDHSKMPQVKKLYVIADRNFDPLILKNAKWANQIEVLPNINSVLLHAAGSANLWVIGGKTLYDIVAPIVAKTYLTVFPFLDEYDESDTVKMNLNTFAK